MVLSELRTVAFVEDEHHALVAQRLQAIFVVALVGAIQSETELLDSGDDDLIRVVVRQQAAHQRFGVGVLFDATFLEAVEFLASLAI
ncbi:hypothetical protein D3C81_2070890 [compost metagenome]